MASPGNHHCANCIGTLSFPIRAREHQISELNLSELINLSELKAVLASHSRTNVTN